MEKAPCIYKITSPSGKIYIGQSVNFAKRMSRYRLLSCKAQPKLYNSLSKYGFSSHRAEILEVCDSSVLDEREIHYITFFDSVNKGMNLRSGGSAGKQSSESIAKMVKANTGKRASEETKAKMSKTRIGMHSGSKHPNYGKPSTFLGMHHTDENKRIMSEKKRGSKAPQFKGYIIAYKDLLFHGRYEGLIHTKTQTGIAHQHIDRILKGGQKQSKGFTFVREPLAA